MSNRDASLYVVDILIAVDKIKRYTNEFSDALEFSYSELEWDATIRELEIIGEATNYLLKLNSIDEKYRKIVNFRNQIIHGYFGIDAQIVWEVVTIKIDELVAELKSLNLDLKNAIDSARIENQNSSNVIHFLETLKRDI